MNIIGIDPGLNCTGVTWKQGDGVTVNSVRPRAKCLREKAREIGRIVPSICWDLLVIEIPQVYQGSKQKGDPNDLINLAILVGGIISVITTYNVALVKPSTWKAQVSKKIHHKRIMKRYPELDGQKFSLDALDSLGIYSYGTDVVAAQLAARRLR